MSWDPRGPEAYCMGNACSARNWLLLGYAGVGHGQLAEVSQGCPPTTTPPRKSSLIFARQLPL